MEMPLNTAVNARARYRVEKPRHLNPLLLFLVVYAAYNLLGLIDTPWIVSGKYDKTLGWSLFLVGLAGYLTGCAVFGLRGRIVVDQRIKPRTSKQLSVFLLFIFVCCLAVAVITSHGLPLLMGESRFENSALASNLAPLYGFWLMVRIISDREHGRKIGLIQPVIYVVGILMLGYRSPVLVFVGSYYVYMVVFKLSGRKTVLVSLLVAALVFGFSATFALVRVAQNYDVGHFFKNVDFRFIAHHAYLLPMAPALSMFDFSQNTIATVGQVLHDPMYGELFLSNYATFLPGRHWGARNIIGDLTGARWIGGRPMSITPTLQGALYVDFGHVGVFFGFLAAAFVIAKLYTYAARRGVLAKFSFCYLMTSMLIAIHSGYWDVSFVFFLFFLFLIRVFDGLKKL
ncbi:hypothetical protein [Paraburkholderia sp.]|uniref:hypothetical protein n=1 Tax=Paraburkholderia sp. TaxID=1926495 RepID=UPI003D6EEB06